MPREGREDSRLAIPLASTRGNLRSRAHVLFEH
jgi:hypothetical protein